MKDKTYIFKAKLPVHPAIIAVWAAVIGAGYLLPAFPILGTGGAFSFSNALSPLAGVFFGPLAGALCAAVGGLIGSLIAPHTAWMGFGTFILGTVTAFTSGCVAFGKWPCVKISADGNFVINGAIIVYIIGAVLWFTQEIGRSVISVPLVVYGIGLAAAVAGVILSPVFFNSQKKVLRLPAIWLCSFAGLIGGASIGNFFSLVLYKVPKEIWTVITVSAPLERAVFAAAAALAGAPLLFGLNKIGVNAGPFFDKDADKHED
ncbi:MAG: hypothetical protein FWC21_06825 [Treponema sp.]|nr:hypothetical protein [Treponema sp.]